MDINITVISRARKREIIDLGDRHFRVKLTSAPEKNKANRELIQILADYFGVKRSAVSIKAGEKSRHKIIQILK